VNREGMVPLKTLREISEKLGIPAITIRRLAARGDIPAYKIGGKWRFSEEEIREWLMKKKSVC